MTFDEYQQSLECLTMLDQPVWERIRAAFEAGRSENGSTEPVGVDLLIESDSPS